MTLVAWTVLPLMFLGWTGVSVWVAHRTGATWLQCGVPDRAVVPHWLVQALMLGVVLPLPVLDELVAQSQWASLCRDSLAVQVQVGAPAQVVHHRIVPPAPVLGLMVPVQRYEHRYTDAATRQVLVSFFTYQAQGGKLARMVGRPDAPLTFPGRCGPEDPKALLARAGVRLEVAPAGFGPASSP